MSVPVILHLAGLVLLFLGERLFGPDVAVRLTLDGVGLAAIVVGLALRARLLTAAEGDARRAHRTALFLGLCTLLALGLYALTLESAMDALGLTGDGAKHFAGVFGALWTLALILTVLPMVLVDRALVSMPALVQPLRVRHALEAGLVVALGLGLVFPVNYLAERHDAHADLRYLKTTAPGTATEALARALTEPVEVVLFFPPANEVHAEVRPYFDALARSSDLLTLEDADQALQPKRAQDLRVTSNGTVALVRGEDVERINLGTELKRARSTLRKLDETVQKHLLELTRTERTIYVTTGHGEAHWAGGRDADPQRRIQGLKRILESLNLRVKELGLREGLGREVPEDAAAVLVLGPTQPLLPEELSALSAYADRGGRLLVAFDPGEERHQAGEARHEALAALLGVRFHPEVVHNERYFLQRTRTPADRALLVTNRFSSHPTMTTLSRLSQRLALVAVESGWLEALEGAEASGPRATDTVRSMPGSFADLNGDHEPGEDEPKKTYSLAMAASRKTGDTEMRGVALADVEILADVAIGNQANVQLAADTLRWLTGDEALSGTVESEEDVRIEHTRDEDVVWFYGTTFGVPVLVLLGGAIFVRRRRRQS